MIALPPTRRPWAVTALVAGMLFLFLALLASLGAVAFNFKGSWSWEALLNALPGNFTFATNALALLLINPWAITLILRRRALGQRLALIFLGYLTLESATQLLNAYSWKTYSTFSAFPHLTLAGRQVLLFWLDAIFFGLLFYLALRPEVFAYTRPDPT